MRHSAVISWSVNGPVDVWISDIRMLNKTSGGYLHAADVDGSINEKTVVFGHLLLIIAANEQLYLGELSEIT